MTLTTYSYDQANIFFSDSILHPYIFCADLYFRLRFLPVLLCLQLYQSLFHKDGTKVFLLPSSVCPFLLLIQRSLTCELYVVVMMACFLPIISHFTQFYNGAMKWNFFVISNSTVASYWHDVAFQCSYSFIMTTMYVSGTASVLRQKWYL